jgi:hypothetical protein
MRDCLAGRIRKATTIATSARTPASPAKTRMGETEVCIAIVSANGPGQGLRANRVQHDTKPRPRSSQQRDAWANSWRLSFKITLHSFRSLEVSATKRTKNHRLFVDLPLFTMSSLVKRGHGPDHQRADFTSGPVECPVVPGFEAAPQHFAAWFGEKHGLSQLPRSKPGLTPGAPIGSGMQTGCCGRVQCRPIFGPPIQGHLVPLVLAPIVRDSQPQSEGSGVGSHG